MLINNKFVRRTINWARDQSKGPSIRILRSNNEVNNFKGNLIQEYIYKRLWTKFREWLKVQKFLQQRINLSLSAHWWAQSRFRLGKQGILCVGLRPGDKVLVLSMSSIAYDSHISAASANAPRDTKDHLFKKDNGSNQFEQTPVIEAIKRNQPKIMLRWIPGGKRSDAQCNMDNWRPFCRGKWKFSS